MVRDDNGLRALIENLHDVVFELDAHGDLRYLNEAWHPLTGFAPEEALGRSLAHYLARDDVALSVEALPRLAQHQRVLALRTACGKQIWVRLQAVARHDADGRFTGLCGTFRDITHQVELQRQLGCYQDEIYHLLVTDPLTGLYNRRHFDEQFETILAEHRERERPLCLLLIDLDGFKFVNDTYGHPVGDEVLRTVAQLLCTFVRRNDYIARMAGDEFAMVLKNTGLENAKRIARKLHSQLRGTPVPLPVGHMPLQFRIGIAESPTHGNQTRDLVSAADIALYQSKRRGGNRIEVLSPGASQAVMSVFSQGFRLREALERGQIHPAFQPIYDMYNGQLVAYEVLARLRTGDTVVPAKDFIELAAELRLTREVDLHIIREALRTTPPQQALFLNVDPASFDDREFVRELGALVGPECAAGRVLTLEITERETLAGDELCRDLTSLRELGCRLALDDFGSGYSTYQLLSRLRPDYLKIDGGFVRAMLDNEADRMIVTHIHQLAQAFGAQTIAESVENKATESALARIGIRNVQGWFYGKPSLDGVAATAPAP